ncbi:MAG TPA: response regulator transcription factor [Anaerolineales bacterium]|nr:response regulator transcription factor [Anaerolineales bacterium]
MSIRILIADDHGLMRAGLRAVLEDEPAIEVVGEASNGEEVLHLTGELLPDIVLLDIGMPGIDGIEATRRLRRIYPQIQVLILTVYDEESLLREAIRAGASGYLIKRAAEDELLAAIQAVSRGDMYIHPAITRLLLKDLSPNISSKKDALDQLTPREFEVMGYIIPGFTNRQIAETLYISMRTVEGHRASLFGKLGLKNRVELVEFAEKHGLKD